MPRRVPADTRTVHEMLRKTFGIKECGGGGVGYVRGRGRG
jgi:hypothetical protein